MKLTTILLVLQLVLLATVCVFSIQLEKKPSIKDEKKEEPKKDEPKKEKKEDKNERKKKEKKDSLEGLLQAKEMVKGIEKPLVEWKKVVEPIAQEQLKNTFTMTTYNVLAETFVDPKLARARIESKAFDIIITDIRMGEINGIQILEWAMQRSPRTRVIMITGYATMQLAREALTKGAFDFIAKPFKMKEVRAAIKKAARALKAGDPEAH